MPGRTTSLRFLLVALALAGIASVFAPAARAQEPTGEIQIEAEWFGVGGVVRAGEWVGVRLSLTDGSDRARDVLLRVTMMDADGDRPAPQRVVTTNPGIRQPVWLYFRLPFKTRQSDVLVFSAYAAIEQGGGTDADRAGFTAGRLLGQSRITPTRQVLTAEEGMIGVVGRRFLGLRKYSASLANVPILPTGLERTEIVLGLDPAALPDRWMGLVQFEALVWNEGAPGQLSQEQAHAIREWVRRGGHLIVVLPRIGQTWTERTANPLFDLVPRVRVERLESVDLAEYRVLITRDRLLAMPEREVVQTFAPAEGATPSEAIRILNGPDGQCLVARRIEGAGAVTLVGLDISARWFNDRGLPDPELFWHRILGRRADLLAEQPTQAGGRARFYQPGDPVTLDRDIPEQIAKTQRAAAGLLIGFVVFIAYWLAAGPVGYFILKRRGWSRHAWLAFVATAGIFTAIAWGGATAIRPHKVDASHMTLLDHVYGQPWQRARSWISLLVPTYGEASLSIGDPAERAQVSALADRFHNAVTPWEAPGTSGGGFPDSRAYTLDSRFPSVVTFPTRATVKQFQVDWAGGPRWRMPAPVLRENERGDPAIRLLPRVPEGSVLGGTLAHGMPGPLQEVVIVVVRRQRDLSRSLAGSLLGPLLSDVVVTKLTGEWKPGDPLDLALVRYGRDELQDRQRAADFFSKLIQSDAGTADIGTGAVVADPGRLTGRQAALAFFTQLSPPNLISNEAIRRGQRRASHGWDLGRWFTRPCVIIVGHLGSGDGEPGPVPLFVDTGGGWREAPSRGRTVVRWVYPLGDDPPAFPGAEEPDEGDGP